MSCSVALEFRKNVSVPGLREHRSQAYQHATAGALGKYAMLNHIAKLYSQIRWRIVSLALVGNQIATVTQPEQNFITKDEDGELVTKLFAKEQSYKSMLKILGY